MQYLKSLRCPIHVWEAIFKHRWARECWSVLKANTSAFGPNALCFPQKTFNLILSFWKIFIRWYIRKKEQKWIRIPKTQPGIRISLLDNNPNLEYWELSEFWYLKFIRKMAGHHTLSLDRGPYWQAYMPDSSLPVPVYFWGNDHCRSQVPVRQSGKPQQFLW